MGVWQINKTTKQNMSHLKLGIDNNFGGIGPENKLFSISLHNNKITSKIYLVLAIDAIAGYISKCNFIVRIVQVLKR